MFEQWLTAGGQVSTDDAAEAFESWCRPMSLAEVAIESAGALAWAPSRYLETSEHDPSLLTLMAPAEATQLGALAAGDPVLIYFRALRRGFAFRGSIQAEGRSELPFGGTTRSVSVRAETDLFRMNRREHDRRRPSPALVCKIHDGHGEHAALAVVENIGIGGARVFVEQCDESLRTRLLSKDPAGMAIDMEPLVGFDEAISIVWSSSQPDSPGLQSVTMGVAWPEILTASRESLSAYLGQIRKQLLRSPFRS